MSDWRSSRIKLVRRGTKFPPRRKPAVTIARQALKLAKINKQEDSTPHSRNSIQLTTVPFVDLLVPAAPNSFPGRCKLTYLRGYVMFRQNVDSMIAFDEWRFDIVLDKQPAKIEIDPDNVYLSGGAMGVNTITAIVNPAASKRYKILYSRKGVFKLGVFASVVYPVNIRLGYIQETSLGNFDQNGVTRNSISVIAWSQVNAANDPPDMTYDLALYSITS